MKFPNAKTCYLLVSLSGTFHVGLCSREAAAKHEQIVREFVGKFYTSYLANALKLTDSQDSDIALKSRPYLFSPDLVQKLEGGL